MNQPPSGDLPVLVVKSTAHDVLYRRYFLPGLPAGMRVVERDLGTNVSDGSFLSPEWQDAMCAKVRHALEFCGNAGEGDVFLVSDVDVQFFPAFEVRQFLDYFRSLGCDMAFQRERFRGDDCEMCCGFYVAANTPAVRALLAEALQKLTEAEYKNEQVVVNGILREGRVAHAALDGRFYARTHGFPPPRDIWMHHANWTGTVPEKIRQLDRLQRIRTGGGLRMHLESYIEHLHMALKAGGGWASATRDYLRQVPLESGVLP